MRALCIITLWIFQACQVGKPEKPAYVTPPDAARLVDTPRTRCILFVVDKIHGPLCKPHEVKYGFARDLPAPCNKPGTRGCTLAYHNKIVMYITADVQRDLDFERRDVLEIYLHERRHAELFCETGDVDANETRDDWNYLIDERVRDIYPITEQAGCYN